MCDFKKLNMLLIQYGVVCLLSGCAYFPPKPASCSGEFRPVNTVPPSVSEKEHHGQSRFSHGENAQVKNVHVNARDTVKVMRCDQGGLDGKQG